MRPLGRSSHRGTAEIAELGAGHTDSRHVEGVAPKLLAGAAIDASRGLDRPRAHAAVAGEDLVLRNLPGRGVRFRIMPTNSRGPLTLAGDSTPGRHNHEVDIVAHIIRSQGDTASAICAHSATCVVLRGGLGNSRVCGHRARVARSPVDGSSGWG